MIIGIDGNEANVEKKVGVSVYTLQLLTYFQKNATAEKQFVVYLREHPRSDMPKETDYYTYKVVNGSFLWSQLFLPLELYLHRTIDVFFSPAHYAPRFCPVPFVVTIHDLSYFYFQEEFLKKDLYKLINWTKYAVEKAQKIIAVSKTTKKDIVKFYPKTESKIEVIYNGFEKNINASSKLTFKSISEKYNVIKETYILYVGTLQPRKNVPVLIKAFKQFKEQNSEFKLVLVGKKGWLYDQIYQEVADSQLTDSVIFTGYVPDDELCILYQNAFCFVLPSLYEGFGVPVLEAMSFGCPVISSFASSLPEVGGEAAMYFDPKSVEGLVDDLSDLKKDSKLKTSLIKRGKERVKLFSWEKTGKETLDIISKAVK